MRRSDYLPRLVIEKPVEKSTLEGRETVDEFLARGGRITYVPPGKLGKPEVPQKRTAQQCATTSGSTRISSPGATGPGGHISTMNRPRRRHTDSDPYLRAQGLLVVFGAFAIAWLVVVGL
jgi:hypothetical protein